jgi:hypothetical protein
LFSGSFSDDCCRLLKAPADFILEDIMVSRSLRQAIDPTNPELPDTPVIGALSKLTQSSLHVPDDKELSVHTAAGAFSKLQQSTLTETENTDVSVPISVMIVADYLRPRQQ